MCRKLDVVDFRSLLRIDDRQSAGAVADNEIARAGIDADIVGVAAQRKAAGGCQILAAEKPHRAVAGAGDRHEIRLLRIAHALRLAEPGAPLDLAPAREVHDFEAAVAERRHQQPLAGEVDGHVIDAPGDPWERDFAFERQGFFRWSSRRSDRQSKQESRYGCSTPIVLHRRGYHSGRPKVTPARNSLTVWPLTRASRKAMSKASLSLTCQIAPASPDTVSATPHSRS